RHGGRRAATEISVARECLPDKLGADDLAVPFNQTSLSLGGEDQSGNTGDGQRVDEPRDDRQGDDEHDCRTDFFDHAGSPQARCKAVTTRSMALMPTNGMIMPPTP